MLYCMFAPTFPTGKATWEVAHFPDGWRVSGSALFAIGRDLWVWMMRAFYMMWGADISPVSPELSTMMHDTPRCHDYFQHPCWKVTVQYVRMWFKQNTAEYHLRLGHWHVKTVQSIVSWHLIYDLLKIKCIKMKGMWCWEIKKKARIFTVTIK